MWCLRGKKRYTTENGYVLVQLPEHPRASGGTILIHRVVMENHLGRLLLPSEVVHHKNGKKNDNRLVNLQLTSHSLHAKQHAAERPPRAPKTRSYVCPTCGKAFIRSKNLNREDPSCSRSCARRRQHQNPRVIEHGTYGRYRKGCRCAACREANTERCRRYRQRG